jgi:hypothetical protein
MSPGCSFCQRSSPRVKPPGTWNNVVECVKFPPFRRIVKPSLSGSSSSRQIPSDLSKRDYYLLKGTVWYPSRLESFTEICGMVFTHIQIAHLYNKLLSWRNAFFKRSFFCHRKTPVMLWRHTDMWRTEMSAVSNGLSEDCNIQENIRMCEVETKKR